MRDLWMRTCERLSGRLSAEMFETWIEPVVFGYGAICKLPPRPAKGLGLLPLGDPRVDPLPQAIQGCGDA